MIQITSTQPPLNLFDVARLQLSDVEELAFEAFQWRVPSRGPASPERILDTAVILTSLLVCNTNGSAITLEGRIENRDFESYQLFDGISIPANGFVSVPVDRGIMISGEQLYLRLTESSVTAEAHLSLIVNQKEDFEVIP